MTMRMAHGSANERPEQTTALTESDSVEVAELSAPAQQLLSAAVLLTAVGVFVVDNLLRPSREVLLDSLPIAAVCLGVLGFLCAAARLLGSIEWGIVACFGLLLGAVFGPHAISAPVAAVLLVLGLADTLRRLRLPRRELMRATGMAATATATIVLTLNPYTSFDMIARLHAGSVRLDTLYHASIGAMIKNYGVVSTGLNGLVPTPYHALSHALYAAISLLSTQPVIEAYGVASWLLFAPLLIFSATACSVMLCGRRPIDAAAAWIAACVLLTLAPAAFGRWGLWNSYFTSESYLVSLTLLLLTLPLLYRRAPHHKDYLLLVILTSAAAAAKASVGFMIIGLYALRSLLLRNGGARRPDALVLLAMAVATALVAYDSVVTNSDVVSLGPVHFIAHYSYLGKYLTAVHDALRIAGSIPLRTWALAMIAVASFVVFHFAVSWTVIADAVRQQGPAALLTTPNAVFSLGAVAAGLAIVFIFRIMGGSAYYFTSIAFFVSLPALLPLVVESFETSGGAGRTVLLAVALAPFLFAMRVKWAEAADEYRPAVRNELIAQLLQARRAVPRPWVLEVDAASAAVNPVSECFARPFVYPAVSERSWVWPVPLPATCRYIDYGYESYRIAAGASGPSVPVRLPPHGRIVPWSVRDAAGGAP